MRICPVCNEKSVGFPALFAAAVGSTSRCSACASGLKFNWVKDVIATLAVLVGFLAGVELQSIIAGVLVAAVLWTTVILSPLIPEKTDPLTFRRELRNRRQANKR